MAGILKTKMQIITTEQIPTTGNWFWRTFQEQMRQLGIERELMSELRVGAVMNLAKGGELEAANRRLIEAQGGMRPIDGVGQVEFMASPTSMKFFRSKFGDGWRNDPKAKAYIRRHYPECVVPYQKKIRVTV